MLVVSMARVMYKYIFVVGNPTPAAGLGSSMQARGFSPRPPRPMGFPRAAAVGLAWGQSVSWSSRASDTSGFFSAQDPTHA
ncbi:hypothetical protein PC116_g16129 [Phytophthora cactorum]|uniref:Uncharacterized protein n=1 Tax=Phytophthora cactorum TaxID=29920 RepID=A0A8T1KK26_9STRA|nr:hypothetical protein PC111_g11083 [Phytophthora cactorum]KAG2901026.1 hypothetical protein PC114_g13341 [Phytophthora cactorum]KAG2914474.1 hypothetical protein PC115_g11685 [Phytophthora cactorum]KAG4235748.1 hypothetical protein PC116_g16129 [Phytophthora cactorum]